MSVKYRLVERNNMGERQRRNPEKVICTTGLFGFGRI